MQAGLATPFPLPRVVDDDAAKGGNASLRFGLPLLAPATPSFDRISVEQPFDIDRFTFGSGTILAGTGPDTVVLGIELALPRQAVPQVEACSLDLAICVWHRGAVISLALPDAVPGVGSPVLLGTGVLGLDLKRRGRRS